MGSTARSKRLVRALFLNDAIRADDLNEQVAIRIAEYRAVPRLIVFWVRMHAAFSLRVPYAIQNQAEDAKIAIREAVLAPRAFVENFAEAD